MSTATVNQTPVITELPITTDKRTYCRVAIDSGEKDAKTGEPVVEYKVMSEDDANEAVKKNAEAKAAAEKEGKPFTTVVTIEERQTFDFDHGNTVDGLKQLFTTKDEQGNEVFNEKELCKQANNAIDIKLGNKARALLLANDENGFTFEAVEGSYSLREYIGQETTSRGKSVFEKMKGMMAKLPPDQIEQLKALLALQQ